MKLKKVIKKVFALYLLLVAILPVFTVHVKAIPKTVTYFEDLSVNTNVTYNTYASGVCGGAINYRLYQEWHGIGDDNHSVYDQAYYCTSCGAEDRFTDTRRNPNPYFWQDRCQRIVTKAYPHNCGTLVVTGTDFDHGDEQIELTCTYTPVEGESSDYTIDWLDSSGKVIGNGDKIPITSAGNYTARVNITVPSGAKVTANTAAFEVKAGGSYQLPVVFVGANPIEVPNLYRIGIKKIYFGNIQIL